MENCRRFYLSNCTPSLKVLITCLVVTLGIGYGVSMLQAHNRGSFNFKKTVVHFRGSDTDESGIYLPQSSTTMISVAHVHTFTQPLLIASMGFLFALTRLSEGFKIGGILMAFLGSLFSNMAPWLIREISPSFVTLLYGGGAAMLVAFVIMALRVLFEVWLVPKNLD